jgi:hypothetical protein
MRRYFFDLHDENGVVADDEGIQLSTLEAVQDEAAHALADFVRDEARRSILDFSLARQLEIQVRDDDGAVMNVKFSFEIKRLQ